MELRRVLVLLSGAVLVAACAAPPAATQQPTGAGQPATQATPPPTPVEIRWGRGTASEEPVWLMEARPDLMKNHGKWYTLKFTLFRAADERIAAYEAGQIDGGTASAVSGLFAADKGVALKIVASIFRESTKPGAFASTFLARADSGIKGPKDLKGKTVGVTGFRGNTEMWARAAVESAGLDSNKDVKLVQVGLAGMGEAIRSGKIDTGPFVQPFYAQEMAKGGMVEIFTSRTGLPFEEDVLVMFLSPDFLAKHPGAARAFLEDYVGAIKWYRENTKEARQLLLDKKYVATPPDVYLGLKDYYREPTGKVDLEGFKKQHDNMLKAGWLAKAVDIQKLVDNSLLP